jgi:hypothetical protein
MTNTTSVRAVFLIYCLQRLADGSYIALNRKYKPLGVFGRERVDYDTHPGRFQFKRALSQRQVVALSHKGDADAGCIYLYDSNSLPTDSAANWRAYSTRLERLAGYGILPV